MSACRTIAIIAGFLPVWMPASENGKVFRSTSRACVHPSSDTLQPQTPFARFRGLRCGVPSRHRAGHSGGHPCPPCLRLLVLSFCLNPHRVTASRCAVPLAATAAAIAAALRPAFCGCHAIAGMRRKTTPDPFSLFRRDRRIYQPACWSGGWINSLFVTLWRQGASNAVPVRDRPWPFSEVGGSRKGIRYRSASSR